MSQHKKVAKRKVLMYNIGSNQLMNVADNLLCSVYIIFQHHLASTSEWKLKVQDQ